MAEELYLKYRPKRLADVVGQDAILRQLKSMGKEKIPHAVMLTGPSGCGKTTLARILAGAVDCHQSDLAEINAADFKGIDDIRAIRNQAYSSPLAGKSRAWIIDECHQLTPQAEDCFLKLLEDTPRHTYFFLATTDPLKVKKTIRTRCTQFACNPIDEATLTKLVTRVAEAEGVKLPAHVAKRIAGVAEFSARKALVVLNAVIGIEDEEEQIAAIEKTEIETEGILLARALLAGKQWPAVAEILSKLKEEPEGLRHMVLTYMRTVLLGKSVNMHARAYLIIEEFRDNFYDSKAAGLAAACYAVTKGGR